MEDNIINVPTEQYQKKDSKTVNIRSYQFIQDKLNIKDSFVLFVIAVLIGKSLVNEDNVPEELPKPNETYTRDSYHQNKLYFNILKAVAVDVAGDISILNDMKGMIDIWERYAYVGFNELCEWYYDSTMSIDSKFDEILLDNYKKFIDDFEDEE